MSKGVGQARGIEPILRRARAAECRRAADEAGFSLVEVCITLVIMGTALATLIYSVSAATTTSKLTEERSQTEETARQVAELVRASSTPFFCDSYDLQQYVTPKVTLASTLTISNTKVSDGDPTVWRSEVPCSSGCPTCALLQTTITVTGSGAQAGTSTVTVLKRAP